jgi:hypothetical protein
MSGARVASTEPPPARGDHAPPPSFIALPGAPARYSSPYLAGSLPTTAAASTRGT